MDTGLKGKTVLITGASRNMGRVAALMFARAGANLALCTSAKINELNQVTDEARALGVRVVAEKCDVSDSAAVSGFVKKTRDKLDSIDVAINIAVYRAERRFMDESFEAWSRNIAVNLNGPFHICRNVIPLMIERRWGRIINVSGIAAFNGASPAKAMAKLGIVGFTRGLAREFGAYNITANCIGPGAIDRDYDPLVREKPLLPTQPVPRKGTPEEVVSLMLYLASENAGFITGQCYMVNGGSNFL